MIAVMTSAIVAGERRPAVGSSTAQPKAQISTRLSTLRPRYSRGHIRQRARNDPSRDVRRVSFVLPASVPTLASPKSGF